MSDFLVGGAEAKFRALVREKRAELDGAASEANLYAADYCKSEIDSFNKAAATLQQKMARMHDEQVFRDKMTRLDSAEGSFQDVLRDMNAAYREYVSALNQRADLSYEQRRGMLQAAREKLLNAYLTDEEREQFKAMLQTGATPRLIMM